MGSHQPMMKKGGVRILTLLLCYSLAEAQVEMTSCNATCPQGLPPPGPGFPPCQTNSGCIFPFTFMGRSYVTCTTAFGNGFPLCATSVVDETAMLTGGLTVKTLVQKFHLRQYQLTFILITSQTNAIVEFPISPPRRLLEVKWPIRQSFLGRLQY